MNKITFRLKKLDKDKLKIDTFCDYYLCLDGKIQTGYVIEQHSGQFMIRITNAIVYKTNYYNNQLEEEKALKECKQEIVKLYNLYKDFKESIHNTSEVNKEH
jgi:hypothetical protein